MNEELGNCVQCGAPITSWCAVYDSGLVCPDCHFNYVEQKFEEPVEYRCGRCDLADSGLLQETILTKCGKIISTLWLCQNCRKVLGEEGRLLPVEMQ